MRGRPAGRLGAYRRLEVLGKHAAVGHIFSDVCRAPGASRPLRTCRRRRRLAEYVGLSAVLVSSLPRRDVSGSARAPATGLGAAAFARTDHELERALSASS